MAKAPPDDLRSTFDACCAKFPPALRHFFLEGFRAPAAWFEARARFTRSVAVSSMAGYVIGLGAAPRFLCVGCLAWVFGRSKVVVAGPARGAARRREHTQTQPRLTQRLQTNSKTQTQTHHQQQQRKSPPGDRHLGNVLLDRATAAVLQIDLGVAFEQGLFLNTPETVPFRLTRDVVDGMGAFGVEGPMRRCCEEAMRVLRRHREALLTVVGVVLHDPLYRWQMNPVKAQRRQQQQSGGGGAGGAEGGEGGGGGGDGAAAGTETAGEAGGTAGAGTAGGAAGTDGAALGNADAARAVLRVKQKLEGAAGGDGAPLSVAAQVGALLAEAQDPDLLCRMFVGWSAWM